MSTNPPPPEFPEERGGQPAYGQQPPQQPPYGQQQPPQYGAYPPQQPPKKKHTLRNVVLILLVVFILFVGGCFALLGTALNEADKAIDEEEANDTPTEVAEGAAFEHDDFAVADGWSVTRDAAGTATIRDLRVTNNEDEARNALLSFRFYKGNENLGEVECTSNELQAGESSRMDCVSFDEEFPTGYETIKVADSW